MAAVDTLKFASPIPGQSLTTEPGARPWEQPSKYNNPDDALNFYLKKLSAPETTAHMLQILESGYPATDLVDAITMGGVLQGLHTIDIATIVSPVIYKLITSVADEANINYKTGLEAGEQMASAPTMQMASQPSGEEVAVREENNRELENLKAASSGLMTKQGDITESEETEEMLASETEEELE
tara:strand:- start:582 stop:1133 length:552 start_codon:yes stop_codon:yes gene_type:complete